MVFIFITNKIGGYNGLKERYSNTKYNFMKRIYRFLNKGLQYETNSYLPLDLNIKGPVNFLHGISGIFISGSATVGRNCTIYQQVTIGSNMLIDSKGFGSPTIGDNCLIGAGAKIIGNVLIGDNCRIGANAVVSTNLPANSVVVMSVPKIYQKENLINHIHQYSSQGWGYYKDGAFVLEEDKDVLLKLESYL